MSCGCGDTNRITIVRGNDTNFNGQNFVHLNITSSVWDLATMKATIALGGITKTFEDLSNGIDLSYTAAETAKMPFGDINGVLKVYNQEEQIATIESLLPFRVISVVHGNAIAVTPAEFNIEVKQGGETVMNIDVEAGVTVQVGTTTTLPAGSGATVTNSGTANHLVLDFGIPKGDKGEQGEDGPEGPAGKDGKDGKDAKINGVNTLTLNTTYGISLSQSGNTATLSGKEITDVVDRIDSLIPAQASEQNQLADKSFVNSSIATNTANFIGTFESVSDLRAYSGSVTNNDYAFVVNQVVTDNGNDWATFEDLDAYDKSLLTNMDYAWVVDGSKFDLYWFDIVEQEWQIDTADIPKEGATLNYAYNRYKATVNGNVVSWTYEYTLNNSSFTASQWTAINSGATPTNIAQITTNKNAIGTLSSLNTSTKTDLVSALNEVNTTASGKVSDVQANNTSLVQSGVATIPLAEQSGVYGLVKLASDSSGLSVSSSGALQTRRATDNDITANPRTQLYRPIVPGNLDLAIKAGLSNNSLTWTDAEKASACSLVGALPNNIYGTSTTAASTVQKEVSIPSITTLNAGQLIIVQPSTTSTVANSTLKLNSFDAYPMLYNGSAITTTTDSIVWNAACPTWFLFDGTNWVFMGHGVDTNTTYNSTTLALMIAGENTTNRLVAPSTLKDGTFGVVTTFASGDTVALADKYLYTSTGDITALTLSTPTVDERYMSQVNFTSGSTATTLTYPNTFKVYDGCDDVQVIGGIKTFVPAANKRYQLFVLSDGVNTIIFAKGV